MDNEVSEKDLRETLETLESDEIDDSEELLSWFGVNGPSMIRELLYLRAQKISTKGVGDILDSTP